MLVRFHDTEFQIGPDDPPVTIGRRSSNRIVVNDPRVSRDHAEFWLQNGRMMMRDNSSNGSLVVGEGNSGRRVHRDTMALTGRGVVYLGDENAPMLTYDSGQEADTIQILSPGGDDEAGRADLQERYREAKGAYAKGLYEEAGRAFQQVVDERPEATRAYFYLASCQAETARYDEAIHNLEIFLNRHPFDVDANVMAGRLYRKSGKFKKAGERFKQAYTLSFGDPDIERLLVELAREAPLESISTTQYLGARRDEVSSDHFVLNFEIAAHSAGVPKILKRLEHAHRQVGERLGFRPDKPVPVRLVSDRAELGSSPLAWGAARPDGIWLLVVDETLFAMPFLAEMIFHEYVHHALERLAGSAGKVPWWLHEGLADLFSRGFRPRSEQVSASLAESGAPTPADIINRPTLQVQDRELNAVLREAALGLAACLHDRCGDEGIAGVVRALGEGYALDRALAAHGGFETFDGLLTEWKTRLAARDDEETAS